MDKPKKNWRWAWWVLAAAMLGWVFWKVPVAGVWAAAQKGRPTLFLGVAITFTIATYLLDSLMHLWLFRRFLPPVTARAVFRARGETYLLLSLGFLYGQGGMAYLMSRRTGKPLARTAGVLLFLMLNSLMAVMLFPTIAALAVAPTSSLRSLPEWRQMTVWLGASWAICAALVLFWARDWDIPLRRRLGQGLGSTLSDARARDYAVALALRSLQVLSWCFFSWLGLFCFGVRIPLSTLLVLGPIIGLAAVIPTPGRLGSSQTAWLLLFGSRYDPAAILAFSLSWTVGISLLRWCLGAVFVALPEKGPDAGGYTEPGA